MIPDIDAEVVEQHAQEADYLWSLREGAARAPAYDLARLSQLDERVEANLDGLRISGDEGWEVCKALLADTGAEAGAVFTAAAVAVARGDMPGVAEVLDVGGAIPGVARGIVAAFGWIALDQVREILPALLHGQSPPELHYLGIAACAAHREDPGPALQDAVASSDARVRARALRAVGELGRADLLPELLKELESDDESCRFAAAWSAAVFGDPSAVHPLLELATQGGRFAVRAADIAMRRVEHSAAVSWLRTLGGSAPEPPRAAIAAAAALGDPVMVPWLIECASIEASARAAGTAFSILTGLDLRDEKLAARPPRRAPDDGAALYDDDGTPWPNASALARAWRLKAPELEGGTRHLLGRPLAPVWLEDVLRNGNQPARAAAALELSIREPKRVVFEVRSPGFRQRRELGGGRSLR